MNSKKNVSLIIALGIPVLMIVLVAASIYLPGLFAPAPQHHFLYVTDDFYQGGQYVVEKGTLIKRELKRPPNTTPVVVRLFIYDVSANAGREVSFEEAQQLRLDTSVTSPDGYEVAYASSVGYELFPLLFFGDGRDRNDMYLKGHGASKKLNLTMQSDMYSWYSRRARFLGWIR